MSSTFYLQKGCADKLFFTYWRKKNKNNIVIQRPLFFEITPQITYYDVWIIFILHFEYILMNTFYRQYFEQLHRSILFVIMKEILSLLYIQGCYNQSNYINKQYIFFEILNRQWTYTSIIEKIQSQDKFNVRGK